jgi:YVTN family beta-propeller protein
MLIPRFISLLVLTSLLGLTSCFSPTETARQPDAGSPPQLPGPLPTTGQMLLPNGWKLSPAGQQTPLGDLPLNMALAPGGQLAAVVNCGFGANSVQLLNPQTGEVLDTQPVSSAWLGLAFGPDGKSLYVSGGQTNRVHYFKVENQRLRPDTTKALIVGQGWPKQKIGLTGLVVDGPRQLLYVTTREDSSLYTLDLTRRQRPRRTKLPAEAYTAVLAPDGHQLYISLWGGSAVAVYDPARQQVTARIPVESHPNDMALTHDGRRLFVANANSNSVAVIDTKTQRVTETLSVALFPQAPTGSTPNSVALSADEQQLFIANADNNCLSVFDISGAGASHSLGFIPTGWYPTAVRTVGNSLLVLNGKGSTSQANAAQGPNPLRDVEDRAPQYIGGLLLGSLSRLPVPAAPELAAFSKQVYANSAYTKDREINPAVPAGNPVPQRVGEKSPIEHVFYIIKENRTYDQVLGDMPAGNGDPGLCIFPEKVTPNHHALAHEFVLLDNFYADAEVSADGHNWSMAAYANDYVEKTWPVYYSERGGTYDYEGGRGEVAEPEDGFLWDYCLRAGISYRSYGEFVFGGKTRVPALKNHYATDYAGYDLSIRDVDREKVWERDFDRLLAAGQLPRLNVLRLPSDHTSGAKRGARTPLAFAADNDLALGRLVEHLSQSNVWGKSVVMVIEDDAQNGSDHVDAHRSTAYLAGPYVKRGAVVHTMYSTSGMLRTLELLLGLPPMSQYDAAATPLWECFTSQVNTKPYVARPANIDMEAHNTAWNKPAQDAEKFDLSREDAAPDIAFNHNIWQAIRGEHSMMPAPRRAAFVK